MQAARVSRALRDDYDCAMRTARERLASARFEARTIGEMRRSYLGAAVMLAQAEATAAIARRLGPTKEYVTWSCRRDDAFAQLTETTRIITADSLPWGPADA